MSSSNRILSAVFLAAALALPARAALVEDVVAKVNGKPILLSEYNKNLKEMLANYQRTLPQILRDEDMVRELRHKILDQMIEWEILHQRAVEQKIRVHNREVDKGIEEVKERSFRLDEQTGSRRSDDEMEEAFKSELSKEGLTMDDYRGRIRRQLMIRRIVELEVRAKLQEPKDAQVQKAFDKLQFVVKKGTSVLKGMDEDVAQAYYLFGRQIKNSHSERVRVSHILVKFPPNASMVEKNKALARAKELKKRLDKGEDFFELARKESDDVESAPRGGDIGFILRGWMPPAFEKVAFSLPVGEVSDPVPSDFGYHLIFVQEKKAAEKLSLAKIKPQVMQFVYNLDYEKSLKALVKKLRDQATVEIVSPVDK